MKTSKLSIALLFFFTFFFSSNLLSADHIIFRNGQEGDVKLYQITDEKIVFGFLEDKTQVRHEVPSKEVYMVYIEKQGNIYITPEGKRKTGETQKVDPKKNDIVYLISGCEIAATNVRISETEIKFYKRTVSGGILGFGSKEVLEEMTLEKTDVFMVRYKSGMSDIITPIEIVEKVEEPEPVEVVVEEPIQEEPEIVPVQNDPPIKVITHVVKRGETLKSIANKYNVTVKQIKEWNQAYSRTKETVQIAVGRKIKVHQQQNQ